MLTLADVRAKGNEKTEDVWITDLKNINIKY